MNLSHFILIYQFNVMYLFHQGPTDLTAILVRAPPLLRNSNCSAAPKVMIITKVMFSQYETTASLQLR